MKREQVYALLTYILLPFAAIWSFSLISSLPMMLVNPATIIFGVAMAACIVYIFMSYQFYKKGIKLKQYQKPSVKKWLVINGTVARVYSIILLVFAFIFITNNEFVSSLLDKNPELLKQLEDKGQTVDQVMSSFRYVFMFIGLLSLVMLAHVGLTFKLMRQYFFLFQNKDGNDII